jgi:Tol biopolymer transport system component
MTTTASMRHAGPKGPRLPATLFLCLALLATAPEVATGGITERVSVNNDGTQINGENASPSISADGRFVAFVGFATGHVFVRDRVAGTTEQVSVASDGTPARGSQPSISADGRFVAFASGATNLVAGGTSGVQIFVRDRVAGTTELISVAAGGGQGNATSTNPVISGNGLVVAFESLATNLVAGGSSGLQVFVRDRVLARTDLVSLKAASNQTPGNGDSHLPSISADGHYVAFWSAATDLVTFSTSGRQFFVRDRITRTTEVIGPAVDTTETVLDNQIGQPSITADGRFVAFATQKLGFASAGAVSVRDRLTGTTQVVVNGTQSFGIEPSISADGRFVAFASFSSSLVTGDTNGVSDVFVRDLVTGTTERVSVATNGAQSNGVNGVGSLFPSISADGRFVAFESFASNLVAGDTNANDDVFVRDRQTSQSPQLSINDVSLGEGDQGTTRTCVFTVSLSAASTRTVTVNFWVDRGPASTSVVTISGAATPNSDYTPRSGTLTFNPGQTSKTIGVTVIGDDAFEPDETFVVNLDVPVNAVIARSPGVGTIDNDDKFSFFGTAELAPDSATVAVHERLTYTVTWTVPPPLTWHDLESVQLRFSDAEGTVLWVRFDEADETFSLLNAAGRQEGPAFPAGHHGPLQSGNARVDLRDSSVQGSGPTGPSVTLTLPVSFKPHAAGRTYLVEVIAFDDAGHEQIEPVGTLTVTP